jgi:hypothetical protein
MVKSITVENHYIHQDKNEEEQKEASHVKVYCWEPGGNPQKLDARKQGGIVNSSERLNAKDGIELYVKETHQDAPNPGKKRFGYIRAYVEWSEENSYVGKITLKGIYGNPKDEHLAKINVEFEGHGPEPSTINVQVGGN